MPIKCVIKHSQCCGMHQLESTAVLTGHAGAVLCVRFNHDASYVMSGGRDKTVRLWNPHRASLIQTYTGTHGYEVRDVAVARDNTRFASAGQDRTAFLTDVASARVIRRVAHDFALNAVALTGQEDGVLVTGCVDKCARLWDLRSHSQKPLQVLDDFNDSVTSCSVADEHNLVFGSSDGCVRAYDVRNASLTTDTLAVPVVSARWSHDKRCLLVSTMDDTVRLLDRADGRLLTSLTGHVNRRGKSESVLMPDDTAVFAGSEDGHVYGWSIDTGSSLPQLQLHSGPVVALDMSRSPDAVCLLSAGVDGRIGVWKPPGKVS